MASLACEREMLLAIPVEPCLAQAGAGSDDRGIPRGVRALVERNKIVWSQYGDAVRKGLQIIEQPNRPEVQRAPALGHRRPRKGSLCHYVHVSPGRPLRSRRHRSAGHVQTQTSSRWFPGSHGRDSDRFPRRQVPGVRHAQRRKPAYCSGADVAGQDHPLILLHCRPSCSISSSASFGPQVPAT